MTKWGQCHVVLVAAERTEAPGRVPEGVKPRAVDRWMQRVIR